MNVKRIATSAIAMALIGWEASGAVFINTEDPYTTAVFYPAHCAAMAQTFVPPIGNPVLVSWEYWSNPRFAPSGEVEFSIHEWSGGAPDSVSLFDITIPWEAGTPIRQIPNINLELTPGQTYAAVIDFQGYDYWTVRVGPDLYPGGNGFFLFPFGDTWSRPSLSWADDLTFRAEFVPVPEPSAVTLFGLAAVIALGAHRGRPRG